MGRRDASSAILLVASFALVAAAAVELAGDASSAGRYDELARAVATEAPAPGSAGMTGKVLEEGRSPVDWEALRELNGAACAWLEVEGTTVDVPVLAAPADDPDRWLSTDVWGNESATGAPYLDARCDADGRALMVFGHRTAYESYLFHDVSPLFEQQAFDGIGRAAWHTPGTGVTTFSPLCAASVDEGDSRWMPPVSEDPLELRAWLAWAVTESTARAAGAEAISSSALRALVLVTCNGRAFSPATRTVAVFVSGEAPPDGASSPVPLA